MPRRLSLMRPAVPPLLAWFVAQRWFADSLPSRKPGFAGPEHGVLIRLLGLVVPLVKTIKMLVCQDF